MPVSIAAALLPAAIGLAALACCTSPAAAQATEPYRYTEGFETGADPVQFWVSYDKPYTVKFKGVTAERARTGQRSFKLDVTFGQASRFLWRIPFANQPPVGGKLALSGHMLLGEGTTGKATLGVSFRFPPTVHSGCTRPYDFYETTHGEWVAIGDDFVARSREIAHSIMGSFMAGVTGEQVGVYLEGIILDLRGEAGQRVVLYVDDLEVSGEIPTAAAHQQDMARRWAPVKEAFDRKAAAWRAELNQADAALAKVGDLPPRAAALHRELLDNARAARKTVDAAAQAGMLKSGEETTIQIALSRLKYVANIGALAQAERAGRSAVLAVTSPVSSLMILPEERAVPGTVTSEVPVVAARGEYEPASFVVSALADLKAVSVAVTDLRGEGDVIPADRVDVRLVKCWYQAGTAWVSIRQDKSKRVLTPELLLRDDSLVRVDEAKQENYLKLRFPDGDKYVWISDPTTVPGGRAWPVAEYPVRDSAVLLPVDIPSGRNQQFWVTVHVPDDAAAGNYTGRITLTTPAGRVGELTVKLRVLPFTLAPPYYTSSMDYHGGLRSEQGTLGSWNKSRVQFRAELANMVAHGLRNCQHYSISREMLPEVLKIRAEVGMDNRVLYLKSTIPIGNTTDPEKLATIKRDVREVYEICRPFGTETIYFYGLDELQGAALTAQRAAWQAVREAGGKIFVAGWGDNVETMADIQDMHVRAGWPDATEVARWHALGHKISCYCNPQTGVENPIVYRRNFGLLLWKYDYDGAATNAYQQTFGATWNDFDHPTYRAHTIAYPTMDGVVDTIAWEGYREAVDDVRYVTTLQQAITAAQQSGNAERRRKAEAAAAFLQQLKAGEEIETGDLDAIRREIIARILDVR
ncbi:MAG: hypothetical protein KKI08_18345 [Armatimonadetes bacterium]|nr:hypothetical protein [Armatimonadota bacterium]